MKHILVWDVPTRALHWLVALGFAAAFAIAELADDDGPVFVIHMGLGLTITVAVALRILWGVVGSRYARFASFSFAPSALLGYFRNALSREPSSSAPHNPAASYAALAMLGLVLGMAVTGLLSTFGSHAAKEVHEVLAMVLLGVAIFHVMGVAWHEFRYEDHTMIGMIDGTKVGEPADGIASTHVLVGAVFLLLLGSWSSALFANYDATSRTIRVPLVGWSLGSEADEEHGDRGKKRRHDNKVRRHDGEHDDRDDD